MMAWTIEMVSIGPWLSFAAVQLELRHLAGIVLERAEPFPVMAQPDLGLMLGEAAHRELEAAPKVRPARAPSIMVPCAPYDPRKPKGTLATGDAVDRELSAMLRRRNH